MIIRLCQDTPMIAIRIAQSWCNGKEVNTDELKIQFTSPCCARSSCEITEWDDCGNFITGAINQDPPSIEYPAFGLDDDGRVQFYFDFVLWESPPGRYKARVMFHEFVLVEFDVDLCCNQFGIVDVAITPARETC